MVNLCCVKNCGSKRLDPDGNKRIFFKVPTDPNRKDEWMAKIVPHLRKGKNSRKILYICDKHFKEDDIERDFSVILINGFVCNVSPRQFLKLKPKSVPSIFECQPNAENTNSANDTESHKTMAGRTVLEEIKYDFNLQNVPVDAVTSSTSTKLHQHTNETSNHDTLMTHALMGVAHDTRQEVDNGNSLESRESPPFRNETPVKTVDEDTCTECVKDYNTLKYDIEALVNDLSSVKMPEYWVHFRSPIGVTLSYFGNTFMCIMRTICIRNDMTVQTYLTNRIANVDLPMNVTSL